MLRLMFAFIALLAAAAAIAADRGAKPEGRRAAMILRPLAMASIVLVAALGRSAGFPAYKAWVLGGLALSTAGDAFMMLPRKRFAAGLGAFLIAHVLYIQAFRGAPDRELGFGLLIPFVLLGLLAFRLISPGTGGLKFPVFVYTAAITLMAWLAADRFVYAGGTGPFLAFAGSLLFMASDTLLGYNRFVRALPFAQPLILGTYYPAQLLIALSV